MVVVTATNIVLSYSVMAIVRVRHKSEAVSGFNLWREVGSPSGAIEAGSSVFMDWIVRLL